MSWLSRILLCFIFCLIILPCLESNADFWGRACDVNSKHLLFLEIFCCFCGEVCFETATGLWGRDWDLNIEQENPRAPYIQMDDSLSHDDGNMHDRDEEPKSWIFPIFNWIEKETCECRKSESEASMFRLDSSNFNGQFILRIDFFET